METLLSYHPRDLLMFSPRVYWTMVATNNDLYWPLALIAPAAGLFLLWSLLRPGPVNRRISLALTGLAWLFVSWSFLWLQYRSVNWAATWAMAPFVLQGLVLLALATSARARPTPRAPRQWLAVALVAWGTLLHPLGFLLDDRDLAAADTWLLFPEPLAVTSLGLALALLSGWRLAVAMPVPLLWSLIGATTLLGLGAPAGWGVLAAPLLALAGLALPRRQPP
ncbi:MAG: DUF6064 family protein [Marinobacter sp.]